MGRISCFLSFPRFIVSYLGQSLGLGKHLFYLPPLTWPVIMNCLGDVQLGKSSQTKAEAARGTKRIKHRRGFRPGLPTLPLTVFHWGLGGSIEQSQDQLDHDFEKPTFWKMQVKPLSD